METSEVAPDEFKITKEGPLGNCIQFCPVCKRKSPVYLWFGFLRETLIVSGAQCQDCGKFALWKKYVLSRLSGTLTQEPVETDDGPRGDHAED